MKILVAAWLWMMTVGLCLVKGNLQHGLITTTISIPYSHILHPMLILFLIKLFQFNLPHTSSIILKLISYFQLTMSIQNPIILQGASLNKQAKRRREPRGLTSHLTMISGRERLWRTSRTIYIVKRQRCTFHFIFKSFTRRAKTKKLPMTSERFRQLFCIKVSWWALSVVFPCNSPLQPHWSCQSNPAGCCKDYTCRCNIFGTNCRWPLGRLRGNN